MEIGVMVAQLLAHLHTFFFFTLLVWISFGFSPNTCRLFGLEVM